MEGGRPKRRTSNIQRPTSNEKQNSGVRSQKRIQDNNMSLAEPQRPQRDHGLAGFARKKQIDEVNELYFIGFYLISLSEIKSLCASVNSSEAGGRIENRIQEEGVRSQERGLGREEHRIKSQERVQGSKDSRGQVKPIQPTN